MMKDIQNLYDDRNIKIQKVGVKSVHLPLMILEKSSSYQHVNAEISLCADLQACVKGTHMSRFMEVLNKWSKKSISSQEIEIILKETCQRLSAQRAEIDIAFRYFIEKSAPMSEVTGMMDYMCRFKGVLDRDFRFYLSVDVPATTVCPCSKEIARYGAHNQRVFIKVCIQYQEGAFIWIEDLVSQIEKLGSADLFSVLKRSDEKYLTETAYDNPKFVEDVVRDVVLALEKNRDITYFEVECDAWESIHNHNAFAYQQKIVT